MAITAIVGRPGHGKSYSAVELTILPALRETRRLYTNIPLNLETIHQDFPEAQVDLIEISEKSVVDSDFWNFAPGALIVLDELWRVWPSGLKANAIPDFQLSFIKEHRHRTDEAGRWQDIVLVTQMLADIALPIREMVETTVVCSQLHDMGMPNRFLREYYTGPVKQFEGKSTAKINNERCEYKPEVWRYYRSNIFGKSSAGPRGDKVVKQNFFKSWKFRLGSFALAVFLIGGLLSARKSVSELEALKARTNLSHSSSPTPAALASPAAPPLPSKPIESTRWRLVGEYGEGAKMTVLISDGHYSRRVPVGRVCNRNSGELLCIMDGELIAPWTGPARTGRQIMDGPTEVISEASSALGMRGVEGSAR